MDEVKRFIHKTQGALLGIIAEEGDTWYNLRLAEEDEPENQVITGKKYIAGEMLVVKKKHILRIEEVNENGE